MKSIYIPSDAHPSKSRIESQPAYQITDVSGRIVFEDACSPANTMRDNGAVEADWKKSYGFNSWADTLCLHYKKSVHKVGIAAGSCHHALYTTSTVILGSFLNMGQRFLVQFSYQQSISNIWQGDQWSLMRLRALNVHAEGRWRRWCSIRDLNRTLVHLFLAQVIFITFKMLILHLRRIWRGRHWENSLFVQRSQS